jgi:RNA polymerase sigma factor (sigma-70 family)
MVSAISAPPTRIAVGSLTPLHFALQFQALVPTLVVVSYHPPNLLMPPEYSKHSHWFAEQVYPHESLLRSWLGKRFPTGCDIDDVIQESYVRILKAKDRKDLKSTKSYLFTIARNLAIDSIRKVKAKGTKPLAESGIEAVIDAEANPQEALEWQQERDILREAIGTLPDRCREIFTLRKIEDMSQSEIAKKLGISVNTVTAQISIGVRKCTAYVEVYLGEEAS